jgi:hypothetical protein
MKIKAIRGFIMTASMMWFAAIPLKAQTSLSQVQQIMNCIYHVYDSVPYITFDVNYTYTSDSMEDGKFIQDGLTGTYTMAGKKAKYNIGDIDFLQNDSFCIAVYNSQKYILVSDPRTPNAGSGLPMRQAMDSLLQSYSQHYALSVECMFDSNTIASSPQDSTSNADSIVLCKIVFTKADSLAQFLSFTITYDSSTCFLRSVEYVFEEPYVTNPENSGAGGDSLSISQSLASGPPATAPPQMQKKKLRIDFSNYRFDNFSDAIYDEEQYIDYEDGTWKPVPKYYGYQVFNAWTGKSPVIYAAPPPAQ